MRVLVIDKNKKPLDPSHPARARKLLNSGQAKVFRRYPFTIIMQELEVEKCVTHPHRLKIDPGAKTTGIAILQGSRVVWAAELTHRGFQISSCLTNRGQLRRARRNRKTRYRKPRFLNRTRQGGWLAPSLQSRVNPPPNPLPDKGRFLTFPEDKTRKRGKPTPSPSQEGNG